MGIVCKKAKMGYLFLSKINIELIFWYPIVVLLVKLF